MSRRRRLYIELHRPFKNIQLLNWLPYNKSEAKNTIIKELEWRDYGGKHYESIFTRFYQGYILPNKFHIDKRKAHLSNLIFSGQITKEEALEELRQPIYDDKQQREDYDFVIKKLGMTEDQFSLYMAKEPIPHKNYGLSKPYADYFPLLRFAKPFTKFISR